MIKSNRKLILIILSGLLFLACVCNPSTAVLDTDELESTEEETILENTPQSLDQEVSAPTEESDSSDWEEDADGVYLVYYEIQDGEISEPSFYDLTDEQYSDQQADTELQNELLDLVIQIFPEPYLNQIEQIIFYTDGEDNDLASVEPVSDEADSEWILYIDPLDTEDRNYFAQTLTHELGHFLTLNADQYAASSGTCQTFETDYGCFSKSSYLVAFVDQFWTSLLPEFEDIQSNAASQEEFDLQIEEFYNTYWDQFVTAYAATDPEEDFSESWNCFVFELEPEGDGQIAWEKIAFFEAYPELVEIAEQIRSSVN